MIQFRPRSILGPIYWCVAALAFGLIVLFTTRLIGYSLDDNHPLQRYLNNNFVVEIIAAIIFFLVVGIFTLPKRSTLVAPILSDKRTVFKRTELDQMFSCDASCTALKEWGWIMSGNGTDSRSTVNYRSGITTLFTVSAQFRAKTVSPQNGYWRCGIQLTDKNGGDVACVHIDNHNLFVGYLQAQLKVKVSAKYNLHNRFVLLGCQVSETADPSLFNAYAFIDEGVYCLGGFPRDLFPLHLEFRAWSDHQKHHLVFLRDISITKLLA